MQLTHEGCNEPIRSKYDNPLRPAISDKAREQVRKAVLYSLIRRPFTTLAKGLDPSAWNLDGFRSRFYREFDAKSDAVDQILRDGLRPERSELTNALTAQMAVFASAVGEGTATESEAVTALGEAYFSQSVNDDVFALQMLAWVAAREQESLKQDFVSLYHSLDQRTVEGISTMLEAWGRTPIEPFSWSDIATTFTALTEGLSIRHSVDPTKAPIELFSCVAVAIVASMTRHESEDVEHIRDRVDLNNRP